VVRISVAPERADRAAGRSHPSFVSADRPAAEPGEPFASNMETFVRRPPDRSGGEADQRGVGIRVDSRASKEIDEEPGCFALIARNLGGCGLRRQQNPEGEKPTNRSKRKKSE
jgi:hypothetical protein